MTEPDFLEKPPSFPRIPHLPGSAAGEDDTFVGWSEPWLRRPLVVEEKLDGANVSLWLSGPDRIEVGPRSGARRRDRAGQLGRLRAWAEEHREALTTLLRPGEVLFAEWMWLQHTLYYDALPDWLVAIDLWSEATDYVDHATRDRRVAEVGMTPVPVLQRNVRLGPDDPGRLCSTSHFGTTRMEGLVVRYEEDWKLSARAKWVRPDFVPKPDTAWQPPLPTNRLRVEGG